MRITSIEDVKEILRIKEKMEEIVNDNFELEEIHLLVEMTQTSDELFWEIMTNAFDKYQTKDIENRIVLKDR